MEGGNGSVIPKLLGAILILAGCGGFGLSICVSYKREEEMLRQLAGALDYMQYELRFRMTPLADLTYRTSKACKGKVSQFFEGLSVELNRQSAPDVSSCIQAAMGTTGNWSDGVGKCLEVFAMSLGQFDVNGQLESIETARELCTNQLKAMEENQSVRLRSYQTLGLCAGAALVILLV